jgi:hypothetical protein
VNRLLLVFAMLFLPAMSLAGVTPETCTSFYQALESVPHESIFRYFGLYASQRLASGVNGCLVVMVTNDVLLGSDYFPDLTAEPGTQLSQVGWLSNEKYNMETSGTKVFGMEKDGALCLVSVESPTYVDDSGRAIQREHVSARVECMDGVQGRCPLEWECE